MSLHRSLLDLLAFSALLFFTGSVLRCEEPPAARLSLQDIRKAAMDRAASIRNVRVEYDQSWKKLLDVSSLSAIHADLTPYHVVFAFDGERRYMDCKPTDILPKGAPLRLHKVVIFDGQYTYTIEKDFSAMIMVSEGKERTCEDLEIYCHNVLQIPYRDQDRVRLESSFFYPYCLQETRGRPPYQVLPAQELVDDHWCHVLEWSIEGKKREKLWVDPRVGCAIRKSESYSEAQRGVFLSQRTHASQFIKGAAGIWVPTQFLGEYFAGPNDPPQYLGRPYLQTIVSAKSVAVNQVTDADFYLPVQPGTIVVDDNGSYRIQGDKTILLNQLAKAAKVRTDSESPRGQRGLLIFIFLPLLALVCLLIWRRWRAWRSRSARIHPPPSQAS